MGWMVESWLLFSMISLFLVIILNSLSSVFVVGEKTLSSSDVYECGIELISDSKAPFYIHFFSVGVLFLLFDIELVVSIPLVNLSLGEPWWSIYWFTFFLFLFFGLLVEFVFGTLDWKE